MAAIGQVDRVQHLAGFGQDRRAIGAVAPLIGGGEDGVRGERAGAGRRRQRGQESRARGLEEIPAVDERALRIAQSPSSDEKPAVRPSAPDSLRAEEVRQAGGDQAEIGELAAPFRDRRAPRRSGPRRPSAALAALPNSNSAIDCAIQPHRRRQRVAELRGLEQRLHAGEVAGQRVDGLAGAPEQRLLRLVVPGVLAEEAVEPARRGPFPAR